MTPKQLREARAALGEAWGLGRPLYASELGRALRLQGRDAGASVRNWERGLRPINGPVSVAVEAMLAGYRPKERISP